MEGSCDSTTTTTLISLGDLKLVILTQTLGDLKTMKMPLTLVLLLGLSLAPSSLADIAQA